MTSLKKYILRGQRNARYHEKYYQIKRNLIISILFLIQNNCILSPQVVYKKAYDISRKSSHLVRHQPQNHAIANHRV